jgi:hypothetical protein
MASDGIIPRKNYFMQAKLGLQITSGRKYQNYTKNGKYFCGKNRNTCGREENSFRNKE